jgi:hypothetical protein
MFLPFESMPPTSRIWIYQSGQRFSEENSQFIQNFLRHYCDQWSAHGKPLNASFKIEFNHFIILAVDESINEASGCSIDTSVNAIKHVANETGLDFFNRELIAFKGDEVFFIPLKALKENFTRGIWNPQTLAFNNLIPTKGLLDTEWLKPASETWLKRYLPVESVKS